MISAVKWGYLYQGQYYFWQGKRRGTPTFGLRPSSFHQLHPESRPDRQLGLGYAHPPADQPRQFQGHDRPAAAGARDADAFPGAGICCIQPLSLFLGPEPRRSHARYGRGGSSSSGSSPTLPRPRSSTVSITRQTPATFERSRLDLTERQRNPQAYALHRDLIRLRREDPVFSAACTGAYRRSSAWPGGIPAPLFRGGAAAAAAGQPGARPASAILHRNRCSLRPKGAAGRYCGRAKESNMAVRELRNWRQSSFWRIPGHAAVVLSTSA